VHVLESDGKVYSATLNQTNMEHNNNKYYIIQVIESDNNKSCFMFTRWGRVGEKGQTACIGPTAKEHAIREYDRKYHEKHVKGEYRHLSMNYGDPAETKPQSKEASPEPKQRPESKHFLLYRIKSQGLRTVTTEQIGQGSYYADL
jgi:poly [ADP-ribose] polymerase